MAEDAPEEASHLPPESAYFLAVNRNKRSITVDFKRAEGLEVLHKLVRSSHVLVENFVSGKLATLGLGWEDCRKINPRLVYASITGIPSSPRHIHDTLTAWVKVMGRQALIAKPPATTL